MAKDIPTVEPAEWDDYDVAAMQALQQGQANDVQQKRALAWILEKACGLPIWPYRPGDSDRDTNIALGRQLAGHQIVKLCRINLKTLRRKA